MIQVFIGKLHHVADQVNKRAVFVIMDRVSKITPDDTPMDNNGKSRHLSTLATTFPLPSFHVIKRHRQVNKQLFINDLLRPSTDTAVLKMFPPSPPLAHPSSVPPRLNHRSNLLIPTRLDAIPSRRTVYPTHRLQRNAGRRVAFVPSLTAICGRAELTPGERRPQKVRNDTDPLTQ